MNQLKIMLLALMFSTQVVSAKPQLEGEYTLQGGALYILPNQQFAVIGYATALAGNYTIQADKIQFHWASEKYPKIIIQELFDLSEEYTHARVKPKANQLLIQFDAELPNSLYIGVNQTPNQLKLKKIFNENVNCVEYSKMNQLFTKKANNSIILYQAQSEGEPAFIRQYQIPTNINYLEIRMNKNELAQQKFQATIQKKGLVFHQGNDERKGKLSERHELSELAEEDLAMVKQIVQQSQSPLSFHSHSVNLENIQLDDQAMIKMKCDTH
ncbi:hypothetical protein [Acinetobacter defluvii]|uniref:hypothetical protein n=1 Tax=Acinetobacter defluvii TaxID=1871111 RepID=UPI003AF9A7B2